MRIRKAIGITCAITGIVAVCVWGSYIGLYRLPVLRDMYAPVDSILILGLDKGNRGEPPRPDVIAVAFVTEGGVSLHVLPRDAKYGPNKLNGLYRILGLSAYKAKIEQIIGHPIKRYLVLPIHELTPLLTQAFPDGLDLPLDYPLIYDDWSGNLHYRIVPKNGHALLKGIDLEAYIRDRKSDPLKRGEGARVERWGSLAKAGLRDLRQPRNLPRLPVIARAARRAFTTDMTIPEMLGVLRAYRIGDGFHLSYAPFKPLRVGNTDFVVLDEQATRRRVQLALKGIIPSDDLNVIVRNGTTRPGIAHQVAAKLIRDYGVHAISGNGASAWRRRTTISFSPASASPVADAIAGDLECNASPSVGKPFAKPTVMVDLGWDYQPGGGTKE